MKARIPVKLKKEAMAEINRLADREYQKVKDKEINDLTRRIFKTIVFALHKDFGFGRNRCAKALRSMTEIIEHSDTDEVFWEHIDHVVIDKLLEVRKQRGKATQHANGLEVYHWWMQDGVLPGQLSFDGEDW